MGLIERLKEKILRTEDSEKVLVTLTKDRHEIERLDRAFSEEMEGRILADINDLHIPYYFENGMGVKLMRINYQRRRTFFLENHMLIK